MGRPRSEIAETLEEFDELESACRSASQRERLQAIRLLKEDPRRTMAEVAATLGRSERSVQRWCETYRLRGLVGLVEDRRPAGKTRRLAPEAIEVLRIRLADEGFRALSDAQSWIV
jgi:transposase